jgi:uncharacterized lipoprotein YbaY
MKPFLSLLCALAFCAGCGHIDLTPEGDPLRVLNGEVILGDSAELPQDTVVSVRLVDTSQVGQPPGVLGSQVLKGPFQGPIAFRIEYTAEDDVLRRGLNVEARVSVSGRVRYYNINSHVVTLSNATDVHRITVDPTGK